MSEAIALITLPSGVEFTKNGLIVTRELSGDDYAKGVHAFVHARNILSFRFGDWLNAMERDLREEAYQYLDNCLVSERTIAAAKRVARIFPEEARTFDLSFSHYQTVAALRLPDGQPDTARMERLLKLAENDSLSVAAFREVIREWKANAQEMERGGEGSADQDDDSSTSPEPAPERSGGSDRAEGRSNPPQEVLPPRREIFSDEPSPEDEILSDVLQGCVAIGDPHQFFPLLKKNYDPAYLREMGERLFCLAYFFDPPKAVGAAAGGEDRDAPDGAERGRHGLS